MTRVTNDDLHIVEAKVCGPHLLRPAFNDGNRKTVDVSPLLCGPFFEPLRDPGYFARAELDRVCGTVVRPNGADFAPEALYELAGFEEPTPA
ncbi:MAG: DUF2442 domain-containing protein [Gemmataceae bacterium]|nr:DUF2442 domain-containing protein [Gemmataceae bacterium]MCI0742049.1 DUF2442 domain-containing protein [Gemmataceae bacterium]